MLTKDKIILAIYVNTQGKSREKSLELLKNAIIKTKHLKDQSCEVLVFASDSNRIELLNPQSLIDSEEALEKLNDLIFHSKNENLS